MRTLAAAIMIIFVLITSAAIAMEGEGDLALFPPSESGSLIKEDAANLDATVSDILKEAKKLDSSEKQSTPRNNDDTALMSIVGTRG